MISSHKIVRIAILCIFIGTIKQVRDFGGRRAVKKVFYVLFADITSFLFGYLTSHEALIILKGATKRAHPIQERVYQCISNNYVIFPQKIIIALVCQCGLFIHKCLSENSIVPKDKIFYLLSYNVIG